MKNIKSIFLIHTPFLEKKHDKHLPVKSLNQASKRFRKYIQDNCLGASTICEAFVFDTNDVHVATVSYNGRVWSADREQILIN